MGLAWRDGGMARWSMRQGGRQGRWRRGEAESVSVSERGRE